MVELTNAQIDAALARGKVERAAEPRATKVRYDRKHDRIIIELTNGCAFAFPPRLVEGLEKSTDDHVAAVEILGHGYGLHWPELDVDLSVQGVLAGIFGTRAHMARLAGRAKSPAKAAASRVNGAKGGRPRKAAPA
jgi:hypothetical protein